MEIDKDALEAAHDRRRIAWTSCRGTEEASTREIIQWYLDALSNKHPEPLYKQLGDIPYPKIPINASPELVNLLSNQHSDVPLDTAREVRQGMIEAQAKGGGKGLMDYLLGKDEPTQNLSSHPHYDPEEWGGGGGPSKT